MTNNQVYKYKHYNSLFIILRLLPSNIKSVSILILTTSKARD